MENTNQGDEAQNLENTTLADVLFYEKPQERKIEGFIEFEKNSQKYEDKKVYSIPYDKCENCPVYRVDKSVSPTAYYCQAGFLFGVLSKAIREGRIPKNCRVTDVRVFKNIR